jgi:gluconate 5-dehydrogenase
MTVQKRIEEIKRLFDLTDKVAIVTGGSGSFGRAVSIGLAAHGADVVVTARTLSSLEKTAGEIQQLGRKALPISCDVVDPKNVDQMVRQTLDSFGKINILVTSAGIALRSPAEEMTIEDWQNVMDINVKGTFLCCQAAGRVMIQQGGGKIITVSSVRGLLGHPGGYSAYGTSKGAIHLLTRQLACEWAKYKINVNSIAPCVFRTPMNEAILRDEKMVRLFMSRIPWGRAAEPEDFVGASVFLASDASQFVTGHILYVDGGNVAG